MSGTVLRALAYARSTTFSSCGDMGSKVNALALGSLLKFTSTRAAFARPGPGTTPFPDVEALTQPSDSLVSFSRSSGSPRRRPTSWGRCLFCRATRRPVRAPADARALEIDYRFSIRPELSRGETRASQVTGPSSSCVPWCNTSPDAILYSPTLLIREVLRRGRHRLRKEQNARHPERL